MTQKTDEKPQLDPKYVKEIDGRSFVLYAGLLDLANRVGMKRLEVEILQYPNEDRGAVCKSITELIDGRVGVDVGEASKDNVDEKMIPFMLSLSATRAKARALRNALNIGLCCLEECASIDDIKGDETAKSATESTQTGDTKGKGSSTIKLVTLPQKRAIKSISERKKISEEDLEKHCQDKYQTTVDKLSRKSASLLIDYLKAA